MGRARGQQQQVGATADSFAATFGAGRGRNRQDTLRALLLGSSEEFSQFLQQWDVKVREGDAAMEFLVLTEQTPALANSLVMAILGRARRITADGLPASAERKLWQGLDTALLRRVEAQQLAWSRGYAASDPQLDAEMLALSDRMPTLTDALLDGPPLPLRTLASWGMQENVERTSAYPRLQEALRNTRPGTDEHGPLLDLLAAATKEQNVAARYYRDLVVDAMEQGSPVATTSAWQALIRQESNGASDRLDPVLVAAVDEAITGPAPDSLAGSLAMLVQFDDSPLQPLAARSAALTLDAAVSGGVYERGEETVPRILQHNGELLDSIAARTKLSLAQEDDWQALTAAVTAAAAAQYTYMLRRPRHEGQDPQEVLGGAEANARECAALQEKLQETVRASLAEQGGPPRKRGWELRYVASDEIAKSLARLTVADPASIKALTDLSVPLETLQSLSEQDWRAVHTESLAEGYMDEVTSCRYPTRKFGKALNDWLRTRELNAGRQPDPR